MHVCGWVCLWVGVGVGDVSVDVSVFSLGNDSSHLNI